jgi:hypothetical protein
MRNYEKLGEATGYQLLVSKVFAKGSSQESYKTERDSSSTYNVLHTQTEPS